MEIPSRRLFTKSELAAVEAVFNHYWAEGVDFGFQGFFEAKYTDAFSKFQGGGFSDAVSSGTAALFVAVSSLELPENSEIIVSPVTDPGGVNPLIAMGYSLSISDSGPGSFNMDADHFERAITSETRAVVVTHLGGIPAGIEEIRDVAERYDIRLIEDCSQAHGATVNGKHVGCFGDIAFFSTMFSKIHASGGCGGIVYTRNRETAQKVRSYADRGKDFFSSDFNPKDPRQALAPGLNFNQDEISCAIGESTLRRLPGIIDRRAHLVKVFTDRLRACDLVAPLAPPPNSLASYFFITVRLTASVLIKRKQAFMAALADEGIWINPDYRFVVSEWPYTGKWITGNALTPNAVSMREESFNVMFHERMSDTWMEDVAEVICNRAARFA